VPWPNSLLRFRKPQVVLMRAYDSLQGPTSELCANLSNLCAAFERLKTASYSLSRLRRTDFWRDCFFSDGGDCKFRWGGGGHKSLWWSRPQWFATNFRGFGAHLMAWPMGGSHSDFNNLFRSCSVCDAITSSRTLLHELRLDGSAGVIRRSWQTTLRT